MNAPKYHPATPAPPPKRAPITTSAVPKIVSAAELQDLLAANPKLTLLDVRTPDEFAEEHIRQAQNVPIGCLQPDVLLKTGAVRRDGSVYLICYTGGRSRIAAEKFAAAGQAQAFVVFGGTRAWSAASLPLVRRISRPGSSMPRNSLQPSSRRRMALSLAGNA